MYGECRHRQCEMTAVRPQSQHPNISTPASRKMENLTTLLSHLLHLLYSTVPAVLPLPTPASSLARYPSPCRSPGHSVLMPFRKNVTQRGSSSCGNAPKQQASRVVKSDLLPLSFFPPHPQLLFLLFLAIMTGSDTQRPLPTSPAPPVEIPL